MDPILFHDRLFALKPDDQLQPETVLVAILLHEKLPSNDLTQPDALWIKCPRTKELQNLVKAYRKSRQESAEIHLRHDFAVIPTDQPVSNFLGRNPSFVAFEAVKSGDVVNRYRLHRAPLSDVTNKANSLPPTKTPCKSLDGVAEQRLGSATPHAMGTPMSSGSSSSPSSTENLVSGWLDFCYECRERNSRFPVPRGVSLCDQQASREWTFGLTATQRAHFAQRELRILNHVVSTAEHRAFWAFYYESFCLNWSILHTDASMDFASLQNFLEETINLWKTYGYNQRFRYLSQTASESFQHPAPTVPPTTETDHLTSSTHSPSNYPRRQLPPSDSSAEVTAYGRSILRDTSSLSSPALLQHGPNSASLSCINSASVTPMKRESNRAMSSMFEPADFPRGGDSSPAETLALISEPSIQRMNIIDFFDDCTTEQFERGVARGVKLLNDVKSILEAQVFQDSAQWMGMIENVQKQAARTKTIVGVVGSTGAGKSSVINAMLDEERLVPTNCMRACTAVVTEISYNEDKDTPYKAEIEFVERSDWAKELKILFEDLLDGTGQVSRDCTNEDSEAGIAYAKLKAVYPKLTKEDLAHSSVEKLMAHNNVNCLGSSRKIDCTDSLVFYKRLQSYVDSKEKSGPGRPDKDKDKPVHEMEFWPLIRVVRLYVRASALSTGAVIVDLPGVHDSNQARAAVAQRYLKQCTGLWIVAPINRAVDDKSAKTLLGDSFKRQLKMDGGYSSVSFICSKTDDISITEAQDSLGLVTGHSYERYEQIRESKQKLGRSVSDLKGTKSDIVEATEDADKELELWEKLQEDVNAGKTVYRPKDKSKKRKRQSSNSPSSRKKYKGKYIEPDSDSDFIEDGSDAVEASRASDSDDGQREELSADQVADKIAELRATKKHGRHQKAKIEAQIKTIRADIAKLKEEEEVIDAELSEQCISGRNDYSRGAIQADFAAGVKEIDEELAQEEDAANFNPDVDVRDYDEVARSLPVFCVSARAYQKLQGRLQKDKAVAGFKDISQTEIPLLQKHCEKLTEVGRRASAKAFMNRLSSLLNSLHLWASGDGSLRNLSEGQLKNEARIIDDQLKKLDHSLDKCVTKIMGMLSEELEDILYDTFPTATSEAETQAPTTVSNWARPYNRDDRDNGGLHYGTYKAVCRRDGVYSNSRWSYNFNEELGEPIIKHIAGPWERAFSRRVPSVLQGLPNAGVKIITDFHNQVETRAIKNGSSVAAFQMLKSQIPNHKEALNDASNAARDDVIARQRDINREFVPIIQTLMLPAYEQCTAERGTGSFMRMKHAMDRHVEDARHSMYTQSTGHVKKLLMKMLKDAENGLLDKVDEIFTGIKRDYTGVVVGGDISKEQLLPREQRMLRKNVLTTVDGAELAFKQVVGLEPMPEEEEEGEKREEVEAETENEQSPTTEEDGSNGEAVGAAAVNKEPKDASIAAATIEAPAMHTNKDATESTTSTAIEPNAETPIKPGDSDTVMQQSLLDVFTPLASAVEANSTAAATDDKKLDNIATGKAIQDIERPSSTLPSKLNIARAANIEPAAAAAATESNKENEKLYVKERPDSSGSDGSQASQSSRRSIV